MNATAMKRYCSGFSGGIHPFKELSEIRVATGYDNTYVLIRYSQLIG
jgi:hypothetical protein